MVALSGCLGQFLTGELADPVPAPAFFAQAVDGRNVSLDAYAGRVVLLDFMGTWCGPCQRGVPGLRDLQAAFPDLEIVSISSTDSPDQLRDFQVQFGAPWPHIADDGTIVRAYLEAGSTSGSMLWPSYAIVDEDGMLRWYNRGETLPATFSVAIQEVTGASAPRGPGATDAGVVVPFLFAVGLGAAAGWSPFLVAHRTGRDPIDGRRAGAAGLVIYATIGLVVAFWSRPLTGRIVNIAPFVAAAALIAVVYWRARGTQAVQAGGRRLEEGGAWTRAWAWQGHFFYYGLPAWFAVTFAAMWLVATWQVWALHVAFGAGLGASLLAPTPGRNAVPGDGAPEEGEGDADDREEAMDGGDAMDAADAADAAGRAPWIGAVGLIVSAAWIGWTYLF